METPKTLQQAIQFFGEYENCRQFMISVRWADGKVRCPHCDSEKVSYLEKARLYRCYGDHPKQKFSLKVGTVFEDSPIGLDKWLPALWLLVSCKNGISSYEVAAALGITQKSAWFMMHRIRLAMQSGSFKKLGGDGGDGAALYSDALKSYEGLEIDYAHKVIDHAVQYVDGRIHTNGLENFWSLLKRGISGTYVSVEPFHLFRYLDEQSFRYNNRKDMENADRFKLALSQIVGKRLTYAEVTGKVGGAAF